MRAHVAELKSQRMLAEMVKERKAVEPSRENFFA
jgi:hypothetical protein